MVMKIGDFVARKSHGFDILFKVIDIANNLSMPKLILKGVHLRVIVDAPENDVYKVSKKRLDDYYRSFQTKIDCTIEKILRKRNHRRILNIDRLSSKLQGGETFGRSGKVLHLDGDNEYLNECLKIYQDLKIKVIGKVIKESNQPNEVIRLLQTYNPDILVITGHDGLAKKSEDMTDLRNYKNSKYFIETVKAARKYEWNMDELVIFAGGCQSYYEGILEAGANFASSPYRVLME